MEKGDLSNEIPRRIIVVANDLLLHFPERLPIQHRAWGKNSWLQRHTEVDPMARTHLHDLTWRQHLRVDVVIIGVFSPEFISGIHKRFDRMNLSVANVYSVPTAKEFADTLAYMPEVLYIVHNRDEWTYAFGSKSVRGFGALRL